MPDAAALFSVGSRLPPRLARPLAWSAAQTAGRLRLAPLERWRANVEHVTGTLPDRRAVRAMVRHWTLNNLWSLSLERWSDDAVLDRALITEDEFAGLGVSLGGPGLILALAHMGSWDFAGAWCARVGIKVVSVAERLPGGLFERFRAAREAMGMTIYAADEPGLMGKLTAEVRAGHMVCLLTDRDLSGRGAEVSWPSGRTSTMPLGAALLARRTGAHLCTTTTHFEGGQLRMRVSAPVDTGGTAITTTQRLADGFGAAIVADPTNWLVLQRLVR